MNYYAVAFSLRPPDLLWPGHFLQKQNACKIQEKWRLPRSGRDSKSQCDSKFTTSSTFTFSTAGSFGQELSAAFYAAYGFTGAFGRNLCKFTFPQRRRNLRNSLLDHKTYGRKKGQKNGCVKNYTSERVERKRSNAGK